MSNLQPIFDAESWCRDWLRHGGRIDHATGAVDCPLAFYIGASTIADEELCRMHRRLGPYHRQAIKQFVRHDPRWKQVSFIRSQWAS